MEIRQLTTDNTEEFCALIKNMYSNLENLEWFTPMPFDAENVKNMLEKPRFYIVGAFENDVLCGVSSLDYKCGKLIGKIDFPADVDTESLVEIGFNMVHSNHRGKGIMKQMVAHLLKKCSADGFKWVFSKVHKDNFASFLSLEKNGFSVFANYKKSVDKSDFEMLSCQDFFSKAGKENAKKTLAKYSAEDTEIIVDYNLYIKKI